MLYLVSTPIGNIEDISLRQAQTLFNSDLILAEDTRSAMTLLHNIKRLNVFNFNLNKIPKVVSYYKEKEMTKLPEIIGLLEQGLKISLISEAGMPIISDPGFLLIKSVIQRDLPYTVIPGPSAVTTALLHTGVKTDNFVFMGFLPKKSVDLSKVLEETSKVSNIFKNTAFIFFESPNRINTTLEILERDYPDLSVIICREMTKEYEEVRRGKPAELKKLEYKGELTVVLYFP
jgi:16S rRNA (cytidine1402-2'-O)-methyltransferase